MMSRQPDDMDDFPIEVCQFCGLHTFECNCPSVPEKCKDCGGDMKWCFVCKQWTKTCCQEYGSCQCN